MFIYKRPFIDEQSHRLIDSQGKSGLGLEVKSVNTFIEGEGYELIAGTIVSDSCFLF